MLTGAGKATKRMIAAYNQEAEPTRFFTGMFRAPPENYHDSEEIEVDVMRSDEDVSVVIQDLSAGYRRNSHDEYTNKAFKPPIHKEAAPLNAFDLLSREPGSNPYSNEQFQVKGTARAFRAFRKLESKIRRAIELQAAQVLQTGTVTLKDSNGTALYTLDYKPKASHFPDAGTAWGAGGDTPLADLASLGNEIRTDGLNDPDMLCFGENAWQRFIENETVRQLLDNRRIEVGNIRTGERVGDGGIFRGTIEIGNYQYEIWSYAGRYTDPATGNSVQYMDPDKVVMRASAGRLDATFGAIPRFAAPDSRVMPYLPPRIMNGEGRVDLWTNAWLTEDGEQLFVGLGARPLMIPTAIDTFGCINVAP